MLKNIKIKLDAIEGMLYYWQATSEKEKVGENYITEVTEFQEIEKIYNDDFTKESIRKVLSAISNRELLNDANKTERKFWNNNMWMTEDLEITKSMVNPIKIMNLDSLVGKINDEVDNFPYEDIEVYFIPGHNETYYIDSNKLIINFFKIMPDMYGNGQNTIEGIRIIDFIENKIKEIRG